MGGLMYADDADGVRDRLTTWWSGGDLGRPAMQIRVPRDEPWEAIPPMDEPDGWVTHYSTSNLAYRKHLADMACVNSWFMAEAMPAVSPDLAPNTLALFLGCKGRDMPGTVWCEPFIHDDDPEVPDLHYNAGSFYWNFVLELGDYCLDTGAGKYLTAFPDLIEGLDTLEAMRGADQLLIDLVDRPEWVRACLRRITDLYFHHYDILYNRFADERGGSHIWAWAPGRMAKFQCDFSAMIGPDMFGEFMVPVLTEMAERMKHCMYHWDGPDAIRHHDHLLSIPELDMLQWTPGAGQPATDNQKWWPLYHKTVEAGKKLYIWVTSADNLKALKKEFGPKLKQFMLIMGAETREDADELMRIATL